MPDETAGWPQDDLHAQVPWLLIAVAESRDGRLASTGRLKAAAMQLLPPLLDGLNARRLSGAFKHASPVQEQSVCERCTEVKRLLHKQALFHTLVGVTALAGTSAPPTSVAPAQKITPGSADVQ